MTNSNEHWERELQMGLDRMDSLVPSSVGDLHVWEQLIVNETRSQLKKLRRELSYFWMIASVVVLLGFIGMVQLPIIYVMVQVVALLGFSLYGVFKERKRVRIQ